MNALFWILQILLAIQAFAGGLYKITNFDEIASMPQIAALPHAGWIALGAFEMICAVLLIVPAATKRLTVLTARAATALALESLALAALYARYSRAMTAANPLVWVVEIAVLAAFVAYGRAFIAIQPARS